MVEKLSKREKAFILAQSLIDSIFEASLRTGLVAFIVLVGGAALSLSVPVLGFVIGITALWGIFTAASYKTRLNDFGSKLQTLDDLKETLSEQKKLESDAEENLSKTLADLSADFIEDYLKRPNTETFQDKSIAPIKELLRAQNTHGNTENSFKNYLKSRKITAARNHGHGYDKQYMDKPLRTFAVKSISGGLFTGIAITALGLALPTAPALIPLLTVAACASVVAGITYGFCHILIRQKNNDFIDKFRKAFRQEDINQQKEKALRAVNQHLSKANTDYLNQKLKAVEQKTLTSQAPKKEAQETHNKVINGDFQKTASSPNLTPTKAYKTTDDSSLKKTADVQNKRFKIANPTPAAKKNEQEEMIGQHKRLQQPTPQAVYHKNDFFDHQKHGLMNYNNHYHLQIETAAHPVNKSELAPHSFVLSQTNQGVQLNLYEDPHQKPVQIATADVTNLQAQLTMLPSLENITPEQHNALKNTVGSWYQSYYPHREHHLHSAPQLSYDDLHGNTALQPEPVK